MKILRKNMSLIPNKKYFNLFDTFFPLLLVFICTLQPYFSHGLIQDGETRLYLPFINEVLHGKVLFKDLVIFRGPLEIYSPAFFMLLFGRHINVLSAWFYLGNILTILTVVFLAKEIFRTRIFLYVLIPLLVATTFSPTIVKFYGGFRFACGLLAVLCLLKFFKENKRNWLFFSGILSSLGFFYSIDIGLISYLTIILTLFFADKNKSFRKNLFIYISGASSILFPFLIYFLVTGGIITFFQNILTIPMNAHTVYQYRILYPEVPHNLFELVKFLFQPFNFNFQYSLPLLLYFILGAYLLIRHLNKKNTPGYPLILCVGLYGLFMYLASLRHIHGHQFKMAIQPALVILLFFLEELFIFFKGTNSLNFSGKNSRLFWGGILSLAIVFLTTYSVITVKNLLVYSFDFQRFASGEPAPVYFPTQIKTRPILTESGKGVFVPEWQAEEIDSVTDFILANTNAGEAIFAFPDQGNLNFFSDRPCIGRFCLAEMAFYRDDWFQELFSQLQNDKPGFIIYKTGQEWYEPLLAEYPIVKYRDELRNFIQRNYEPVVSLEQLVIYKRLN